MFRSRTIRALLLSLCTAAAAQAQTEPSAPAPEAKAAPKAAAKPAAPEAEDRDTELEGGLSATVRSEKSVLAAPRAVGVVTRQDLQRNEGLVLDDVLNLVPGVRVESRTLSGGQRITIRGYGNGTNFNGTGYKAYLNGIPLTDAEGTTILNDVDISTLGRIEVIKGPASSQYGAGIAGVVNFFTLQPEPDTTKFTQEVVGGTQSLLRTNTRAEQADGTTAVVANYGHQQSDGYRIDSAGDRDYAMFSANYRPNNKEALFVYASYNHAFDHLPGELTPAQFFARTDWSDPQYLTNHAHIAIEGGRVGLSNKYSFAPGLTNTTSVFASGYSLDQPSAAGLTDNSVFSLGGRTELTGRIAVPWGELAGSVGTEVERSSAFKKSYNLGAGTGALGGIKGDLQVGSLQSNSFLQVTSRFPMEFELTAGASVDFVRYAIIDRLANTANPAHLNQSGTRTFDPFVAPRLALQKSFGPELSVYAQVSAGYTPPASSAVVISQSGTVNTGLKPESGLLYELGSKGNLLDGRLSYEAALFDLVVQDKLTSQSVTDAFGTYNITTNAGKQSDLGLELSARYALIRDAEGPIKLAQVFASYALSSFHYDGFKSDNNSNAKTVSYDGNKVVGVPPHVITAGLDVMSHWGVYANATFQHVSPMPIVYDNSVSAPAYGLLDAKVGYRADLLKHLRLDLSLGSRNLTGSLYYTEVFLNALGNGQGVYLNGPYNATFYGMALLAYVL